MKTHYLPPESESIMMLPESFICVSTMDGGDGAIDPIVTLDLDGDTWFNIL